jgi:SPP1 family predicted phage head-tail adaptor
MPTLARTGDRNVLITIQKKVVSIDSTYGSEVVTWAEHSRNWAKVTEALGGERVSRDIRVLTRTILVEILYTAGIKTDMRILLPSGRILQIVAVAEQPRQDGIILECEEYSG